MIKGLSEAINKFIIRELPARVEIPLAEAIPEEAIPEEKVISRERQHKLAIRQKQHAVSAGMEYSIDGDVHLPEAQEEAGEITFSDAVLGHTDRPRK